MSSNLLELCQEATHLVSFGGATQQELDLLGELLDQLEFVEIYLESNPPVSSRNDSLAELDSLTDRIQLLVDKV